MVAPPPPTSPLPVVSTAKPNHTHPNRKVGFVAVRVTVIPLHLWFRRNKLTRNTQCNKLTRNTQYTIRNTQNAIRNTQYAMRVKMGR
jgi:hypothetical protein